MNTQDYNTRKPKEMGEFYSLIGQMLSSGIPEVIKEARHILTYKTPNIETIVYTMKNHTIPAIEKEHKLKSEFKAFMKDFEAKHGKCPK